MSAAPSNSIKFCRLCAIIADNWQDEISINLFDKSNEFLIQYIKELTGLTLKDMPRQMLPRCICSKCRNDLSNAWEFRSKIIKAQNYFKSKDYKSHFEAREEDQRPAFAFVPLNEYESNDELEIKPFLDDSDVASDYNMTAAEAVETILKQEASDVTKTTNTKSTRKTRTRKKSADKFCTKRSKEVPNVKEDQNNVVIKNEASSAAAYDSMKDCADNTVSDDSSTENVFDTADPDFAMNFSDSSSSSSAEDSDNVEDPDFVMKIPEKKQNPELLNDTKTNEEPDILKDRQFHCYLCQCPLESLIQLKIHFQKQHKKEKFKCDLCEEKLPTIKSFARHLRIHKEGEKQHKCHFCDMTFKYSTIRCRHERREHSKDPPFLCFICGKVFITTSMGYDHMTVHTKFRAFHCTVCKADFLRKSHLNTHYRSMTHKNNEQKMKEDLSMTQNLFLPNEQTSEPKIKNEFSIMNPQPSLDVQNQFLSNEQQSQQEIADELLTINSQPYSGVQNQFLTNINSINNQSN